MLSLLLSVYVKYKNSSDKEEFKSIFQQTIISNNLGDIDTIEKYGAIMTDIKQELLKSPNDSNILERIKVSYPELFNIFYTLN